MRVWNEIVCAQCAYWLTWIIYGVRKSHRHCRQYICSSIVPICRYLVTFWDFFKLAASYSKVFCWVSLNIGLGLGLELGLGLSTAVYVRMVVNWTGLELPTLSLRRTCYPERAESRLAYGHSVYFYPTHEMKT
jgi:hypothetical protein